MLTYDTEEVFKVPEEQKSLFQDVKGNVSMEKVCNVWVLVSSFYSIVYLSSIYNFRSIAIKKILC